MVLSVYNTPKRDRIRSAFIMSQSCNKQVLKIGSVALPLDGSVRIYLMKCVMHQAGCACDLVLSNWGTSGRGSVMVGTFEGEQTSAWCISLK